MKAITESGASITLDDQYEITRGGEGKILSIPELPHQVAKIYLDPNYQHMSLAQKNALAVLDDQIFVKPQQLIFHKKHKNILGFTMEYLSPDFLPLSAFFNKNFCGQHNLDEAFKITLGKKLIQALQSAHQQDIIIGDLSGLNILVNLSGQIKFIDVDSYETPVHSHWGLLLDEIRDHLYQGKVSKQSDYFALAVLVFNLLTHVHPFKGIHKQCKSLAERMIRKLPVFINDPQLIVPKCYWPIQESNLQNQFSQIFAEGQRFLLRLQKSQATRPVTPATKVPVLAQGLKVQEIYQLENQEFIQHAYFCQTQGYIRTNQQIRLYDLSNYGYISLKESLNNVSGKLFVSEQYLFTLQEGRLKLYQGDQNWLTIQNFQASAEAQFRQVKNMLVVLDQGYLRSLFLDQVMKDQMYMEQTPVFVPGIDVFNGLVQNVGGGNKYIFYHSGSNLSNALAIPELMAVNTVEDLGIAVYPQTEAGEVSIRYEYFQIQNLRVLLSGEYLPSLKNIAVQSSGRTKIIFEPADDKLVVRNGGDFKVLQEIACPFLHDDTQLSNTQAGIIAFDRDFCYLLNSN